MELSGTINRSITLSGSMIARGLDGRGIVSIAKTGTSGLVDTYTITYTDATTSTFTVTNGANGQITATSFAEEFSSSKAYAAGDYVVYSGQLYQFTTAHAAGAWNASHATAVQIADQVGELKSAIFKNGEESFSYSVGSELDRKAPYMANEKYGINVLSPLSKLTIATKLHLNVSCSITFSIKDSDGTLYGAAITNAYTIDNAGDLVSVSLVFNFNSALQPGQYYFWMQADQNSAMSYGYSASAFPSFKYLELTADGGYNGTAGQTSVAAYRMLLNAKIGGVAQAPMLLVDSRSVTIENKSVLGTLTLGLWTKTGDVLSLNYTGAGNTWFYYVLDIESISNNIVKVTGDIQLASSSSLRLYVFGKNTSGTTLYLQCGDVTESCQPEIIVDLNNFVIYRGLDLSQQVSIGFANQSKPCVATITGFNVEAYDTTVPENNVFDALARINNQIDANTKQIASVASASGTLTSPDGTKFFLAVSNAGVLSAIRAIPAKTLFIGNSLLLGNTTFGMNATDNANDYYHHVTSAISSLNPSATFQKLSGTTFEAATTISAARTWMTNTLSSYLSNDLDLVVVQLGDNVNNLQSVEVFETSCGELISYIKTNAPNARVAWVGEWYYTAQKQQIITAACAAYGAVFIDISGFVTDVNKSYIGAVVHKAASTTTAYTVDSCSDDSVNHKLTVLFTVNGTQYTSVLPYTSYTVSGSTLTVVSEYVMTTLSGVASHPGNDGMLTIANAIINGLGLS